MNYLHQYNSDIERLCNANKVKSLFAFGSVTTEGFSPESDIDLLVELSDLDPISYSDHYFQLKFGLEQLLKRRIDLLEQKALRNKFLIQEIERTKVLIYAN